MYNIPAIGMRQRSSGRLYIHTNKVYAMKYCVQFIKQSFVSQKVRPVSKQKGMGGEVLLYSPFMLVVILGGMIIYNLFPSLFKLQMKWNLIHLLIVYSLTQLLTYLLSHFLTYSLTHLTLTRGGISQDFSQGGQDF